MPDEDTRNLENVHDSAMAVPWVPSPRSIPAGDPSYKHIIKIRQVGLLE